MKCKILLFLLYLSTTIMPKCPREIRNPGQVPLLVHCGLFLTNNEQNDNIARGTIIEHNDDGTTREIAVSDHTGFFYTNASLLTCKEDTFPSRIMICLLPNIPDEDVIALKEIIDSVNAGDKETILSIHKFIQSWPKKNIFFGPENPDCTDELAIIIDTINMDDKENKLHYFMGCIKQSLKEYTLQDLIPLPMQQFIGLAPLEENGKYRASAALFQPYNIKEISDKIKEISKDKNTIS